VRLAKWSLVRAGPPSGERRRRPSLPVPRRGFRAWLSRAWTEPRWWFKELFGAGLVGIVLLIASFVWDYQLQQRVDESDTNRAQVAERLENLRFVRARSSGSEERPFTGMDLQGQSLSGLEISGADFIHANLAGADMIDTDLTGANLTGADLPNAVLVGADLDNANLDDAVLSGANLYKADLSGAEILTPYLGGADLSFANLTGADLSGASLFNTRLSHVCYDNTTDWPDGFEPPSPSCGKGD